MAKQHGGRRPGAGRKKGVPNKLSGDLKSMILDALDREGGVKYLQDVAREDRKAFCALLGRVVPMQVMGDEEGGPVRVVMEVAWAGMSASSADKS